MSGEEGAWDAAKISDAQTAKSALFNTVYYPDDNPTKESEYDKPDLDKNVYYIIGHRCATLVPASETWPAYDGDVDDDTIIDTFANDPPVELLKDPVKLAQKEQVTADAALADAHATTKITIGEGNKMQTNIHIFAEDLVIYRGSYFNLPTKNLTLFVRRLIVVDAPSTPSRPNGLSEARWSDVLNGVTFDCSGRVRQQQYWPDDSNRRAGDGREVASAGIAEEANIITVNRYSFAEAGVEGTKGNDGQDGAAAGSIYICGTVMAKSADTWLRLWAVGSDGMPGQRGGNGSKGGNGLNRYFGIHPPNNSHADGAKGGKGGRGGNGGCGGTGGRVHVG